MLASDWPDLDQCPPFIRLASLNLSLHSVPPPGSGAVLGAVLNILDNYNYNMEEDGDEALLYQRVLEAFKWGYGARTRLGDHIGDPDIAGEVLGVVANITGRRWGRDKFLNKINDDRLG